MNGAFIAPKVILSCASDSKAVSKAGENKFIAPYLMLKLAVAYEKQQNLQDALAVYEKIKANFPTSEEAREALKMIPTLGKKLGK